MSDYINSLKAAQDNLDIIQRQCRDIFNPYRDAFFNHIVEFTTQAVESGLRGYVQASQETLVNNVIKLSTWINDIFIIAIANNEVYKSFGSDGKQNYCEKILLYACENPQTEPFCEVSIQRYADETFICSLQTIGDNGKEIFKARIKLEEAQKAGVYLASKFIQYCCEYEYYWAPRPKFIEAELGKLACTLIVHQ